MWWCGEKNPNQRLQPRVEVVVGFITLTRCDLVSLKQASSEPLTPIRHPPAHKGNRNRCQQRPPDRQYNIRDQPEHDEHNPENLLLHAAIVESRPARRHCFAVHAQSSADAFTSAAPTPPCTAHTSNSPTRIHSGTRVARAWTALSLCARLAHVLRNRAAFRRPQCLRSGKSWIRRHSRPVWASSGDRLRDIERSGTFSIQGRWPTQARLWLEWGFSGCADVHLSQTRTGARE